MGLTDYVDEAFVLVLLLSGLLISPRFMELLLTSFPMLCVIALVGLREIYRFFRPEPSVSLTQLTGSPGRTPIPRVRRWIVTDRFFIQEMDT